MVKLSFWDKLHKRWYRKYYTLQARIALAEGDRANDILGEDGKKLVYKVLKRNRFRKQFKEDLEKLNKWSPWVIMFLLVLIFWLGYVIYLQGCEVQKTASVMTMWKKKKVECTNCTIITPQTISDYPIPTGTGDVAYFDQTQYIRGAIKFLLPSQHHMGECWFSSQQEDDFGRRRRRRFLDTAIIGREELVPTPTPVDYSEDEKYTGLEETVVTPQVALFLNRSSIVAYVNRFATANPDYSTVRSTGIQSTEATRAGTTREGTVMMQTTTEDEPLVVGSRSSGIIFPDSILAEIGFNTSRCGMVWNKPEVSNCSIQWYPYLGPCCSNKDILMQLKLLSEEAFKLACRTEKVYKEINLPLNLGTWEQYENMFYSNKSLFLVIYTWITRDLKLGLKGLQYQTVQNKTCEYTMLKQVARNGFGIGQLEFIEHKTCQKIDSQIIYNLPQRRYLNEEMYHEEGIWTEQETWTYEGNFPKETLQYHLRQDDLLQVAGRKKLDHAAVIQEENLSHTRAKREADRRILGEQVCSFGNMQLLQKLVWNAHKQISAEAELKSCSNLSIVDTKVWEKARNRSCMIKIKDRSDILPCWSLDVDGTRPPWASKPCRDCHIEKWTSYPALHPDYMVGLVSGVEIDTLNQYEVKREWDKIKKCNKTKEAGCYSSWDTLDGVYWKWQLYVLPAENYNMKKDENDPLEQGRFLKDFIAKFPKVQQRLMWNRTEQSVIDETLCRHKFSVGDKGGSCFRQTVGIAVPMASKYNYKNWMSNNAIYWWQNAMSCLAGLMNETSLENVTSAQQMINWYNVSDIYISPFRGRDWDQAMYLCSRHLPDFLETGRRNDDSTREGSLRGMSYDNATAFMDAWMWFQLSGLTSGYVEWDSWDTEVMHTLVVPYVLVANVSLAKEERYMHTLLALNEWTDFDYGVREALDKINKEMSTNEYHSNSINYYPDTIIKRRIKRWSAPKKQGVKDLPSTGQQSFIWPWLTEISYGDAMPNWDQGKMSWLYQRNLYRIERHHHFTQKHPGACQIMGWLEPEAHVKKQASQQKHDVEKSTYNNPSELYQRQLYLSASRMHTVKLLEPTGDEAKIGKEHWSQVIQSHFPNQITTMYTTERSKYHHIYKVKGGTVLKGKHQAQFPLQPETQIVQLRWRQPDGSVAYNQGMEYSNSKKEPVIGKFYNITDVECSKRAHDETVEWRGLDASRCKKVEVKLNESQMVNENWAYASHLALAKDRQIHCVDSEVFYPVAHWPKHAAPIGFLQGHDAAMLGYHRFRFISQSMCKHDKALSGNDRGKIIKHLVEEFWIYIKDRQLYKNSPFYLGKEGTCSYGEMKPRQKDSVKYNITSSCEKIWSSGTIGNQWRNKFIINLKLGTFVVGKAVEKAATEVKKGVEQAWTWIINWFWYVLYWIIGIAITLGVLILVALVAKFCKIMNCLCWPCRTITRLRREREDRITKQRINEIYDEITKTKKRAASKKRSRSLKRRKAAEEITLV